MRGVCWGRVCFWWLGFELCWGFEWGGWIGWVCFGWGGFGSGEVGGFGCLGCFGELDCEGWFIVLLWLDLYVFVVVLYGVFDDWEVEFGVVGVMVVGVVDVEEVFEDVFVFVFWDFDVLIGDGDFDDVLGDGYVDFDVKFVWGVLNGVGD